MYHVENCQSASAIKAYFNRDEPGAERRYGGKGYQFLGVDAKDMDRKSWNKIVDNVHPTSGRNLTPRTRADGIRAWHMVFSPPKDYTILEQMSPIGPKVRKCLWDAIDHVMSRVVEPGVMVRRRVGKHADVTTGNLMWMAEYHRLARPQDGKTRCQSHVHVVPANASYDKDFHAGPRFVATKMRHAYFDSKKIINTFHRKLREGLESLGVETVGYGMSWRIPSLDRATIDLFSPRRDAALRNVEKGIHRSYSSLVGRSEKQSSVDLGALEKEWRTLLTPRDASYLESPLPPKRRRERHLGRERMERMRQMNVRAPEPPRKEVERGYTIA